MVWVEQTDYVRATTDATSWCNQNKQIILELQQTLPHGVSRTNRLC